MAFTWQIIIQKKQGGGFEYNPNPLTGAASGDQVSWRNDDDQPHQPSLLPNPIAPDATSDTFVVAGPVSYIDTLNPGAPGGAINVT